MASGLWVIPAYCPSTPEITAMASMPCDDPVALTPQGPRLFPASAVPEVMAFLKTRQK